MATADEKLCLQWNDFKDNVSSAFGDLRQDNEFTDVTLACEDGQQMEAQKAVLIASSPFFLNILQIKFMGSLFLVVIVHRFSVQEMRWEFTNLDIM